jgi:hypothetical protein
MAGNVIVINHDMKMVLAKVEIIAYKNDETAKTNQQKLELGLKLLEGLIDFTTPEDFERATDYKKK